MKLTITFDLAEITRSIEYPPARIACALREAANWADARGRQYFEEPTAGFKAYVRDADGRVVGAIEVSEPEPK